MVRPQRRHKSRSRSTVAKRTGTQALYDNRRNTSCRPRSRIWQGRVSHTCRNCLNSMPSKVSLCSALGCNKASQALKLHANAAITMYAQLDTNVLTGKRMAFTPFSNCSIRFSVAVHRDNYVTLYECIVLICQRMGEHGQW